MTTSNDHPRDDRLVEPDPPNGRKAHAFGVGTTEAASYCGNIVLPSERFDQEFPETAPLDDNLDLVTCRACRYMLNLPGGAEYES